MQNSFCWHSAPVFFSEMFVLIMNLFYDVSLLFWLGCLILPLSWWKWTFYPDVNVGKEILTIFPNPSLTIVLAKSRVSREDSRQCSCKSTFRCLAFLRKKHFLAAKMEIIHSKSVMYQLNFVQFRWLNIFSIFFTNEENKLWSSILGHCGSVQRESSGPSIAECDLCSKSLQTYK